MKTFFLCITLLISVSLHAQSTCAFDSLGICLNPTQEAEEKFENLEELVNAIHRVSISLIQYYLFDELPIHKIEIKFTISEKGVMQISEIQYQNSVFFVPINSEFQKEFIEFEWFPATCEDEAVSSYVSFPIHISY